MSIRRFVPNIKSDQFDEPRDFYVDLLGFQVAMDLGVDYDARLTDESHRATHCVRNDPSGMHPDLTVEVGDYEHLLRGELAGDTRPQALASAKRLIDLHPRRVLFSHDTAIWDAQG